MSELSSAEKIEKVQHFLDPKSSPMFAGVFPKGEPETFVGALKSTSEDFVLAYCESDERVRVMPRARIGEFPMLTILLIDRPIPAEALDVATRADMKMAIWAGPFRFDGAAVTFEDGIWKASK